MQTLIPNLPETFEVPQSFRDTHYTYGDLMRILGLADDQEHDFWLAYKSGRIPPGVWLPAEHPMICWNREFVDSWVALGCPAQPGVLPHEKLVYDALLKSVAEENTGAGAATFGDPTCN